MRDDEMQEAGLPQAVAERLDQLLIDWRRQRQLDEPRAAAIRQAVLAEAEGLPAMWRQEHQALIHTLVGQTRRLANELASAGLAQANAQRKSWRAGQWATTWSQAYVRLG
jgi:hypothetical protein